MLFETALRASQGARRAQEDTAIVWPSPQGDASDATLITLPTAVEGLVSAVLCDGMGGHAGGAMASRLACEAFLPSLLDGVLADEPEPVRHRLIQALEMANTAISEKVSASPTYKGMGSTLVGVHLASAGLTWVSVGDSLLYHWRQGELSQLNADHSLAPEIDKLAESGKITWAAARADPRRHYLRSALTGDDIELVDLAEYPWPLLPGDIVLLASDGIHTLEPETIAAIIADTAAEGVAAIAGRLVGSVDAVRQSHQDNTTVVAIRVLPADV